MPTEATAPADAARPLGPGALVLVVGPSGAGKDTLIGLARAALAGDRRVVFPRRLITRPPDPSEDSDEIGPRAFEALVARGGAALAWRAHGLGYAVPASADAAIASGRIVVVNVSRRIVPAALEKYARVTVVLVTAPRAVLAERIAARGRESAASVAVRLERAGDALPVAPSLVVIDNVGPPAEGAARLVAVIRDLVAGRAPV